MSKYCFSVDIKTLVIIINFKLLLRDMELNTFVILSFYDF